CPLALGQVSGTAGQEWQALFEPLEDLRRRQRPHARGGQLESERQVIEATTDLGDHFVLLEIGLDRPRSRQEEVDALLAAERRHRELMLTTEMERLPAGYEQIETRARAEQGGRVGRRLDDLLEVVEQQQHRLVGDVFRQA